MSWILPWFPYIIFCSILICQADFVPLWDSWIYAECAAQAARVPMQLEAYACAGHLSHGYIALLALPTRLCHSQQTWHALAVNALLGCLAIRAGTSIARSMCPASQHRWEVWMTGLLMAVHPQLLASAVFVNVDFGVYVFGLATLAALLAHRYVLAALTGCFLVLSKETGVGLYLIFVACHTALQIVTRRTRQETTLGMRLPGWLVLGVPMALVLGEQLLSRTRARFSAQASVQEWLRQFFAFRCSDPREHAVFAALGVLQFQWLLVGVWLLVISRWLLQRSRRPTVLLAPGIRRRAVSLVAGCTVLSTWALTRPQTYVNTRYFTILYALSALLFVVALMLAVQRAALRRTLVVLIMVLLAVSSFRTIDPLSKRLYGTFAFGEHELLRMTSVSKECCGAGLDQLAYNLEFVQYHRVLDAATRSFRPNRARALVVDTGMNVNLFAALEPSTGQRTMPGASNWAPLSADRFGFARVVEPKPTEALFLALPNATEQHALSELRRWYTLADISYYEHAGYGMFGFRLRRSDQ